MNRLCAGFVLLLAACGPGQVGGTEDASSAAISTTSLKDMASNWGVKMGGAVSATALANDATYRDYLRTQYSVLTPENAMKQSHVQETSASQYDYTDADALVTFARANGMSVHGHTLVWHKYPTWLDALPKSQIEGQMKTYISKTMGRYKGEVWAWDVVNEAFSESGTVRASVWYSAMGSSYIEKAFLAAHAADPAAKLVYNDYGIHTVNTKSNAVYAFIKGLLAKGVPIHGVAFQMHESQTGFDYDSYATNMARFAALGLELYVSEMDVKASHSPATSADLQAQASVYWNTLDKSLGQHAFKSFQMWGLTDKYSDIASDDPLLYSSTWGKKPAWYAVESRFVDGGLSHTYQLVNRATGKALHTLGNATTLGSDVVQYASNPSWAAQRWQFAYVGGRGYHVVNLNSKLALKVRDGVTTYGAAAEQFTPEDSMLSESWEPLDLGNGYVALFNRNSYRVLAASGTDDKSPVIQGAPYAQTGAVDAAAQWKLVRDD